MEKSITQVEYQDFVALLYRIRSFFWAILLTMLVFGGTGYFVSTNMIEPQYESAITMIVNTRQDNAAVVTNDNINSAKNLVTTYSVIIRSNTVLEKTIELLDLDMRYETLYGKVTVEPVNGTPIMRIAVKCNDKELSKQIVKTISEVAPDIIVDSVEAGSCKVISKVMTSEKPVTPNVKKNVALMAALGLLSSLFLIILLDLLKERCIVTSDEAQNYLDIPVLGIIPEVKE